MYISFFLVIIPSRSMRQSTITTSIAVIVARPGFASWRWRADNESEQLTLTCNDCITSMLRVFLFWRFCALLPLEQYLGWRHACERLFSWSSPPPDLGSHCWRTPFHEAIWLNSCHCEFCGSLICPSSLHSVQGENCWTMPPHGQLTQQMSLTCFV